MASYLPLAEQATELEGVVAQRYPEMSADDRAQFASAVLFKLTDMLRRGDDVELRAVGPGGRLTGGRRALVSQRGHA